MGEIYAKIFVAVHIPFFSETHLQVRPFSGFLHAMAQTTRSRARMCLLGVKKFEINIQHIYSQKSKKLQWRLWGKLSIF